MSDATDQTLAEAFELIEADKLTEAEALLKPILEEDENNVDAWWLYAHAVSNPETARMALNQVLRLDESYTEARDMLAELDTHFSAGSQPQVPPPTELPEIAAETDDSEELAFEELEEDEALFSLADDDEPVFGDRETTGTARESAGRSRLPVMLLILLIIIVLIIAFVVVLNPFSSSATPTATNVAQQAATAAPTIEAAAPTDVPPTVAQSSATDVSTATIESTPVEAAAVSDDLTDSVRETLAGYELAPDSIEMVQTSLNNTLVAGVCSRSNRAQLAESLQGSLTALASIADTLPEDVQAIGIALVDCDNENRVLRMVGVAVADAAVFAADEIEATDFQALWQAINVNSG